MIRGMSHKVLFFNGHTLSTSLLRAFCGFYLPFCGLSVQRTGKIDFNGIQFKANPTQFSSRADIE